MKPAFLAALLFCASVSLAWTIDTRFSGPKTAEASTDPLFLALGSAKEAIGDTLFIKADEYFHGGVIERGSHEDSAEDLRREGVLPEEAQTREASKDWIDGINRQVHAGEHMHLAKEKRKEMLPFFKWATQLDTHNVEAILTTAYWLGYEFGNVPEAVSLLQKGIQDNPRNWELERDLAKLYVREGDLVSAEPHFREAAHKSVQTKMENFERVSLYYEWAKSAEAAAHRADAFDAYTRATRYFDAKTTAHLQSVILDRIKQLSAKKKADSSKRADGFAAPFGERGKF